MQSLGFDRAGLDRQRSLADRGWRVLFFAFPKAYTAGFSGFYLALIIVLWLLIARGLALELRSHLDHPLWRQLWDTAFSSASLLLAIVFGAALGNLIRGVPLNQEGYFFVALWTDFLTGPEPGILDWFTILTGLTSASVLALHGACHLAMKAEGELHRRADSIASLVGWVSVGFTLLTVIAVPFVQPKLRLNFPVIRANISCRWVECWRLAPRSTSAAGNVTWPLSLRPAYSF